MGIMVSLTLFFGKIWQLAQGPGHVRKKNKPFRIQNTGKTQIPMKNAAADEKVQLFDETLQLSDEKSAAVQ
jgi:hypothetical protein